MGRPALAAALDHAEVRGWEGGKLTLHYAQRFTMDQAERGRAEIERVVSELAGAATRVVFLSGQGDAAALVQSEVGREADAASEDRRRREDEARQHPMIRKAQELFGVSAREIKT